MENDNLDQSELVLPRELESNLTISVRSVSVFSSSKSEGPSLLYKMMPCNHCTRNLPGELEKRTHQHQNNGVGRVHQDLSEHRPRLHSDLVRVGPPGLVEINPEEDLQETEQDSDGH